VQSVKGVCGACERYHSSILRYPFRVYNFFLFFNLKISRYVRDMYLGVSGQYPISEQYLIPVWQKSEVSMLPRCQ
jgi:hypothetical protein